LTKFLLPLLLIVCAGHALRANDPPEGALGTFILGATTTQQCPTGFTCNNFRVNCPGIPTSGGSGTGQIAVEAPVGQPKGVIMFFSGSGGGSWWGDTDPTLTTPFFNNLLNEGYELVQVRWKGNGWFGAPLGNPLGFEVLACRPATVIQWTHDNIYAPLGLHPGIGQAGFAVMGSSAGSAAITYALSEYAVGGIIDVAVPVSGPPFAEICDGCLQSAGCAYTYSAETMVDDAFGYVDSLTGTGPCVTHNANFCATWTANSVETGGVSYNYPSTRIHIIIGGQDDAFIKNRATDYFQVLSSNNQPMLSLETVAKMGHAIQRSPEGLAALFTSLNATPVPTPSPTPTPTPP
jgi:hypothetical protein